MENFQVIELQRRRDFSQKMNATFEFIRQNFAPLCKSILIIAGPPVLIGSLLLGSFIGQLMGLFTQTTHTLSGPVGIVESSFSGTEFWLKMLLMFIFMLITGVITLATINNYIMLYAEKRTNKIEVSEVWQRVRETFWMYFGTTILFALLLVAAYSFTIVPVAGALIYLGSRSTASIPLIFIVLFILIGALFYFLVSISLVFIIRANEKKGFFAALARSFKLVKNKWWSTFGLIVILYMIMGIVSYIPLIPFYIASVINTLHSVQTGTFEAPSSAWQIWTTIFISIYYLLQTVLNTLPNVGIAFQYFNLVELKEARGLMNEIQTLGQQQETNHPEEHF